MLEVFDELPKVLKISLLDFLVVGFRFLSLI